MNKIYSFYLHNTFIYVYLYYQYDESNLCQLRILLCYHNVKYIIK